MAGRRDGHQVEGVLLVGERLGVGEHPGGHVVPRQLPLGGDEAVHVLAEALVRLLRPGAAVREVLEHPGDVGALLVGEAHEAREHEDGQRLGVFGDEVGGAPRAHGVDEPVGQLLAVLADFEGVHRFERGDDHVDVAAVLGPRGEVDGRHGRPDHGQERPVGGDVLPLVPEGDVPGEQLPVAGDLVELPVADHQPGGDAAVQLDGDDGPVLAPHPPVQLLRFGVEAGSAERDGPGAADGAAACGGRGRGGRGVRHRTDSRGSGFARWEPTINAAPL